jgi:hypothetical protein
LSDPGFLRFPSTPHLVWLGNAPARTDKMLSEGEASQFLAGEMTVEEKVDGANVGFSLDAHGEIQAQNRGGYLHKGAHPQFQPLWHWLAARREQLVEALGRDLILFGEWCFAVHSIEYDALPDWFLAFDVYDRSNDRFWSVDRRNAWCADLDVMTVPRIARGRFNRDQILSLLGPSRLTAGPMEGLYLRKDESPWLVERAKLVRPQFVQAIDQHWTARRLRRNHLAPVPLLARG